MLRVFLFVALCWSLSAAPLYGGGLWNRNSSEKTETEADDDPLEDQAGTVKYGDYSRSWKSSWVLRPTRRFTLDSSLVFAAVLVLCAIGTFASIRGIGSAFGEGASVKAQTLAIISGDFMPIEKKERLAGIKERGLGLRFKIASFSMVLTLLAVIMVSAPLYYMMMNSPHELMMIGGKIRLLEFIIIVALAALVIGIIGSLALSSFIIRPIRKLVQHVEKVRDIEDKSKLAGMDISIDTKDEIAVLGATINSMTQSLVKASMAASDLSIGKEIQKQFIPLDLDREGDKLSSGYKDTKNARFFGYYEGAKGVSGDYFDYLDLDGRYYAIIKSDVAGKGVSAALITTQLATMFLNYFKHWKPSAEGMHIENLVYQINEFFEGLGIRGLFAAFTLCLFDSETGVLRFCNAGDNIIHYYDASGGSFKSKTLPGTPATGALTNAEVKSRGGYQIQAMNIDHDDILLLYTDGIEESKRSFRDPEDFREILCGEGPDGTPHGNHVSGQWDEEFGSDRIHSIIDAVMNKRLYTLHKWHNAEGDKPLHFDFSGCKGNVEEVIMALVSVEKMFRLYKDPKAGEDSRILVDKKIDAFLKARFHEYREYCLYTREYPDNEAYMYYTHVKEDEQYDDLTILGIKRK